MSNAPVRRSPGSSPNRGARRLARVWTCALVLALLCVVSSSSVGAYAAAYASRDPEVLFLDVASQTELTSSFDLFRNAYVNAEGQTVVASADGSKVVAPGTSGSYEFAVRNTGGQPATYQVWAEASQDGASVRIPLRISLANGSRTCENLAAAGELAPSNSAVYRIAWEWPFEDGAAETSADGSALRSADARDTALGDAAASRRASYNVNIHMTAQADYPATSDATAPATGDVAPPAWPIAAAAAVAIALALGLRARACARKLSDSNSSASENAR